MQATAEKQTCKYKIGNDGYVYTSCKWTEHMESFDYPYCRHCGKKIERLEREDQ